MVVGRSAAAIEGNSRTIGLTLAYRDPGPVRELDVGGEPTGLSVGSRVVSWRSRRGSNPWRKVAEPNRIPVRKREKCVGGVNRKKVQIPDDTPITGSKGRPQTGPCAAIARGPVRRRRVHERYTGPPSRWPPPDGVPVRACELFDLTHASAFESRPIPVLPSGHSVERIGATGSREDDYPFPRDAPSSTGFESLVRRSFGVQPRYAIGPGQHRSPRQPRPRDGIDARPKIDAR
jgi:hypothetical protein